MIDTTAYASANCRMTVELLLIQHIQCKYICSAYAVYNAASRWPTIQPALFWYNTWALCNLCAEKGRIEEMLGGGVASAGQACLFFCRTKMQVFRVLRFLFLLSVCLLCGAKDMSTGQRCYSSFLSRADALRSLKKKTGKLEKTNKTHL